MENNRHIRILIYGAGVIGSIYAGYLSLSGCEVSVLARGHRLEELRQKGLLYRKGKEIQKAGDTHIHTGDSLCCGRN